MSKNYDKIIKENIEQLFLPLSEKYLGIKIIEVRNLSEKLQTTIEREPDFIKVITTDKDKQLILHLEFQTTNEPDMVYRMAEYKAMIQRKFKIPVKQFVIYLGTTKPKMKTRLSSEEIIDGFTLTDIHQIDPDKILESNIPEEIILAILTDYSKAKAEEILIKIVQKLNKLCEDEIILQKYLQQLMVLSRLRNLGKLAIKKLEEMPITYNVKKDHLYKKGRVEGAQTVAQKLLEEGMSVQKVSEITDLPVRMVEKIAQKIKK